MPQGYGLTPRHHQAPARCKDRGGQAQPQQRPHHQVQGHRAIACFNLRHPRLAGTQNPRELRLANVVLGAHGLATYIYAPKEDPLHRAEWRTPYDAAFVDRFAAVWNLPGEGEPGTPPPAGDAAESAPRSRRT